jgi:hypothetical protein
MAPKSERFAVTSRSDSPSGRPRAERADEEAIVARMLIGALAQPREARTFMPKRELQQSEESMELDADWTGNNAAFTCPKCSQVFLVSGIIHRKGRQCPRCNGSLGTVVGSRKKPGGSAILTWD